MLRLLRHTIQFQTTIENSKVRRAHHEYLSAQCTPMPQHLCDTPGLGKAASRGMRVIAIEYLTDCT